MKSLSLAIVAAASFFLSVNGTLPGSHSSMKGSVIDQQSHGKLAGATILLKGNSKTVSATADDNGDFLVNDISVGIYSLTVSYVGYNERTENSVVVKQNTSLAPVALTAQIKELPEVVITAAPIKQLAEIVIVAPKKEMNRSVAIQ